MSDCPVWPECSIVAFWMSSVLVKYIPVNTDLQCGRPQQRSSRWKWWFPLSEPQLVHSSMHTVKIRFIQTTVLNTDVLSTTSASDDAGELSFFLKICFLTITSNFTAHCFFFFLILTIKTCLSPQNKQVMFIIHSWNLEVFPGELLCLTLRLCIEMDEASESQKWGRCTSAK